MKLFNSIKIILKKCYGIHAISVKQIQGGWSALAYVITDNQEEKFIVKAYDKTRASTAKLTSKINVYAPVLEWLNVNTNLRDKITCPVKTIDGNFQCEDNDSIYLLSKYIEGGNLTDGGLSAQQVAELSGIIAELHNYSENIPLDIKAIEENFDINFCFALKELINSDGLKPSINPVISPYRNAINEAINQLEDFALKLKSNTLTKVLCHTDIHEGNIILTKDGIALIDWEGLKAAPPEADLFGISEKTWGRLFLEKYIEKHPHYTVNADCLKFYRLRRKLEDIWEFTEQLQFDRLTPGEEKQIQKYLEAECSSVKALLRK